MYRKTIRLPEIIIDTHCHGRGLKQTYKTTVQQTMSEAIKMLVVISIFMPNTDEPIITIEALDNYIALIRWAKKVLGVDYPQYVYFGITDYNLAECEIALRYPEVIGLKDYPLSADGKPVTTGTIGVSKKETRLAGLRLVNKYNKVYARHCDNPEIISLNGGNNYTIDAEVIDVKDMISIASEVPGSKVIICHVSCRESAEIILKAQKSGMQIIIELCPHYLWFDAEGTNWNPDLDPVFYKCFNNLRSSEDREFLISLLLSNNPLIIIGSDNAPHTTWEKIEKKLGGLPSNQEMVAVICTLAKQHGISDRRVAELLSWNTGKIFGIKTSKKLKLYELVEKIDNLTYNNGVVTNPWNGSKLLFPVPV